MFLRSQLVSYTCNCEILNEIFQLPFEYLKAYEVLRCGAGDSVRACDAAGPDSIPGVDKFPGWGFFRGFSSSVRQISGNIRPHSSSNIIWASQSSLSHPPCECVREWYVLSLMFVLSRRWPRHWADHSSMSLCVQKYYVCDPQLIPSPHRSWLCKAQVAWVT